MCDCVVDLLALGNSVWNDVTPAWEKVHGGMGSAYIRGQEGINKQGKTNVGPALRVCHLQYKIHTEFHTAMNAQGNTCFFIICVKTD